MPENNFDTAADEQGQAQEPTLSADADENTQEPETAEQPTTDEVADAVKEIEDDEADDAVEDDADADEASAEDSALLRKLRRKNREAKSMRERAHAAEQKALRYEVAAQTGLPLDLSVRLQGSTAEELTADAEKLMELVGPKKHYRTPGAPPATGDRQGSFRATPETETDLGKIGSRIYER